MKHLLPAWIWLRPVITWFVKTVFTELVRILVPILLGLVLRDDQGG